MTEKWTLIKTTDLDSYVGEHLWDGTFEECMTIAQYEGLYSMKIHRKANILTVLALFEEEEDQEAWKKELLVGLRDSLADLHHRNWGMDSRFVLGYESAVERLEFFIKNYRG